MIQEYSARATYLTDHKVVVPDATCFLSPEWQSPMVIGWKTCLESMRFGLDPTQDLIYYAAP